MATILLKAVEYPEEKVLELEDLTDIGLAEIKQQAEEIIDTIEMRDNNSEENEEEDD